MSEGRDCCGGAGAANSTPEDLAQFFEDKVFTIQQVAAARFSHSTITPGKPMVRKRLHWERTTVFVKDVQELQDWSKSYFLYWFNQLTFTD